MMANMLTYYASKSTEYSWKENGLLQYPDENFAREIMQLFTVGLVQLNDDGTTHASTQDSEGTNNAVYSNKEIMEIIRNHAISIFPVFSSKGTATDGE